MSDQYPPDIRVGSGEAYRGDSLMARDEELASFIVGKHASATETERTHTCGHCGATLSRRRLVDHLNRILVDLLDDLDRGRWCVHDLPSDLRSRLVNFLSGVARG